MASPRLRTKLAAAAASTTEDEEMKGKGAETDTPAEETEKEKKKREEEEAKKASAAAAAAADPVAADRARTKAITSLAGAKSFPALASHLAYDLAVTAEQANAVFAAVMEDVDVTASAAPAGGSAAGPKGDAFRRAMAAEAPNPALGTGASGGGGAERLLSVHEIRAAKAAAKNK